MYSASRVGLNSAGLGLWWWTQQRGCSSSVGASVGAVSTAEFGPETRYFLQQQCAFVARTHIPTEAFQALERVVERVVGAVSLSREGVSWEGGVF